MTGDTIKEGFLLIDQGMRKLAGGLVWHASAAHGSKFRCHKVAKNSIGGVGDAELGEWHEWSGFAYHVRRRLKPEEELLIGPAIDIRGTHEATNRWNAISIACPWLSAQFNDAQISRRELTI